jgi:predicted RecB family nuclease
MTASARTQGDPRSRAATASELGIFLECDHRVALEILVREKRLDRPGENEITRELLARRGRDHEQRVLEHYRGRGLRVVSISVAPGVEAQARAAESTLAAMRDGADVIHQGAFIEAGFFGRPDFLIKAEGAGGRFGHHYEAVDAKLAAEAKASAVLQLCAYTEQLTNIQGVEPKLLHIAVGGAGVDGAPVALAVRDCMAYYRSVRARYDHFARTEQLAYPEPVEHCGVCPFWKRCEDARRADDHLSLVAGSTRRQRDRLNDAGIARVTDLAKASAELVVEGIAPDSLARLREQAALQVEARSSGRHAYRLLGDADRPANRAGQPKLLGLEALPLPTPGDLFLDLEGDPFVRGRGIEYLFGLLEFGEPDIFTSRDRPGPERHLTFWAHDAASEKRAFEAAVDRIIEGREEFRLLHVYHFGHRESDALKRLSCRHKTREEAVDEFLRDGVLVDLYPILRQALRASVESYTLKALEPLHGFARATDLREAARAMQLYGYFLETGELRGPAEELRRTIQAYNREDCLSTARLRDFLEGRRAELEARDGRKLARPAPEEAPRGDERKRRQEDTAALARRLSNGLPDDPLKDQPEQRARRLLADLLGFHYREEKSSYWEYFRARDVPHEDRLSDRSVLAELRYEGEVDRVKQSIVHRYRFPEQEHAIRSKPSPLDADTQASAGNVTCVGSDHIDLKRGLKSVAPHPNALLPGKPIEAKSQESSLFSLGEALARSPDGAEIGKATWQLLRRAAPELGQTPGAPLVPAGESPSDALPRLALAMRGAVLAIQGPPGSGKTHQAALMILALLREGRRVGVTANSHAVIGELLGKVMALGGAGVFSAHHLVEPDDADASDKPYGVDKNNAGARARLRSGSLHLLGGTSWVWSHPDFENSVDVLVVDEAGQVALANVLSIARAAENLVLVGDPAQLEQPQKGVHPDGADVSALEHLLGGDALTIPPELGVFLPDTRRLHPEIARFVSNVFYDGRLSPIPGLERHAVHGSQPFDGAGLRYVAVPHRGNTNHAPEEVARIVELIAALRSTSASVVLANGETRPLHVERDVLFVAPYNAQVAALKRALGPGFRVGTVDKFQGKEAPIVVYSLTSSSAEEAPRGLEFLYSTNRLNVAVSRAQALAVVVGSPELTRVSCKTPRQVRLVNALCTFLEMARV